MTLQEQVAIRVNHSDVSHNENALANCALAKKLEESGNYEAARAAMGKLWQRVGERPQLLNLSQATAAEVLLRVGALTGWIATVNQIEGAQETAKDLISESIAIFQSLDQPLKAQEGIIELAYCYWRQGSFDEARVLLSEAIEKIGDADPELQAKGRLRLIIVERTANKLSTTFQLLQDSAALFEKINNHTVKGGYHVELAVTLKNLGKQEQRADYIDRALLEYEAASFHFEQAGHLRYRANVENNLGNLFFELSRFEQAHKHLDRARRLFVSLKDKVHGARTDETLANVLLAQGRNSEAERCARSAVRTLEGGGEQALLAQMLTTHAVALARLNRAQPARVALRLAIEIAEQVGDREGAGRAALTLIEELGNELNNSELRQAYEEADELTLNSQDPLMSIRLRKCARFLVKAQKERDVRPTWDFHTPNFIHASEETGKMLDYAERVALTQRTLLITGETGTGKEILAQMVHRWSERPGKFVAINCAALTETLFESEVFGHKKGSFTDAVETRTGAAREAAEGTLFLDEVAELSPRNQAKLLRLVESGEIHPVGAQAAERINVRIIAATNRDLRRMVDEGLFRADLYYRLTTHLLDVPPLSKRPQDIPAIALHLIEQIARQYTKRVVWSAESLNALQRLPLPGNARELRSLIERTMLLAEDGQTISAEGVEVIALRRHGSQIDLADAWRGCVLSEEVQRYEGELINRALTHSGGNITRAAGLLGTTHQSLSFILNGRQQKLRAAKNLVKRRKSIITKDLVSKKQTA